MIKLIHQYKIPLIGISLIVLALIVNAYKQQNTVALVLEEEQAVPAFSQAVEVIKVENEEGTPVQTVPVYVCGQVVYPGVYFIEEQAILQQVLEEAGGVLPEADVMALNLARQIKAHEKIYVPKVGEQIDTLIQPYDSNPSADDSNLVNINTASEEAFNALPGIGDVKAKAIIDYRNTNGAFQSKESIQQVSGIGDKTYQLIEAMITTE